MFEIDDGSVGLIMMAQLPNEIWSLVAGQVYAAEDINDLLSMCLVSRDFHAVTTVWLYRSIILDWNCSDRILELLAERITSRTAYYVREFNASSGRFGCDDYQLKLLQSVVQRLPTLRRFKWNEFVSIPDFLLEDLNKMDSTLELDLSYHVVLSSGRGLSSSTLLQGNMKLARLALRIRCDVKSLEENSNFQQCKNMISQAPALKSLTICCESGHSSASSASFSFFPDEVLPPLETLVLENYALGGGGPNNIENRLDVAKLRALYLRDVYLGSLNAFFRTLLSTPQINLKHLSIKSSHRDDASSEEPWHNTLDDFLESFVGLESLVLHGDCASKLPSLSAIIKHGDTLQLLKIHSPRTFRNLLMKPELGFTAEKLQAICKSCPHLCELAIDLDRDMQSNELLRSIQQSLRNFPSLRKLEIYTPLSRDNMCLLSPPVDQLYVNDFAARVCSPRLEDLTVRVGSDEEYAFFDGHLSEQLRWENRYKFAWRVRYYAQTAGFISCISGQAQQDLQLKRLAGLVGMQESPPQGWDDYKAWSNELGTSMRTYMRKLVRGQIHTDGSRLGILLANSLYPRA